MKFVSKPMLRNEHSISNEIHFPRHLTWTLDIPCWILDILRPLNLIALILGVVICSGAFAYPPTAEELKADRLKNKKPLETLDPARSNWKAVVIGVDGVKEFSKEDYVQPGGKPWSFDSEVNSGIKGKLNVTDFKVSGETVSFTTKAEAEIFWGNHFGNNPEYGEESIGKDWWGHWNPMWLSIRIRQSLPESAGEISVRGTGSQHAYRQRIPLKLKGTDWQTLDIGLGDSRTSYASLSVRFNEPGNKIEISALSVYTKHLTRVYEKTIEVKDNVEMAAFCLATSPRYKIHINGKLACEAEQGSRMGATLNRYDDMGKFFIKGTNTIRIEAETYDWSAENDGLIFDGAVYDKSGNVYRLSSDSSWKARYATAKEGDAAFKPVRILGPVKGHYGYNDGGAFYLNAPDYGMIQATPTGRKLPIFRPGEKPTFSVDVFGKGLDGKFDLVSKVTDSMDGDKPVSESVLLKDAEPAKLKSSVSFNAPRPGVYNVELILKDSSTDKTLDRIVFEAVSVGKIEQREVSGSSYKEGLDLKLVDSIDCVNDTTHPSLNCLSDGTDYQGKVIEKPFGKYLTGSSKIYSWLSYKIETPDYSGPYLLELDYPDDDNRVIGVSVGYKPFNASICNDSGNRNWPTGVSGVYTGFGNKITNTMRTMRMVFYPPMPVGTVDILNAYSGTPAGVSAIRVYKIMNDLPALKVFGKRDRITGIHAERIDELPDTYYNGDMDFTFSVHLSIYPFHGFYKAWYITNQNLIKYMNFIGENMLIAGMQQYNDGYFYPSSNPDDMKTRCAQADCAALLGEMFAANDLNLLLGVEFSNTASIRLKDRVSDQAVAAGAHSYRNVDRNGRQVSTWNKVANIVEPEIRDGLYNVIDDLCRLYKDNPGIKGFALQEGVGYHPTFPIGANTDPLDVGFEDFSIAAFEKASGIKIPVANTDKDRFLKRHDWLMANAKDKWVAWRCGIIYEVNKGVAERAKAANPEWLVNIISIADTTPIKNKGYTIDSFQRASAFYPPLYKDSAFCVGRNYAESIRHKAAGGEGYSSDQVWNESQETADLFESGNGRTCIQTGPQFVEPGLTRKNGWYWGFTLHGAYCLPADNELNRLYNRLLVRDTPYMIAQFWTDMNLASGNEQQRRIFNRAFTTIPAGKYKTLRGNGLDSNVVVRASGDNFYIVNPLLIALDLTVKSSGASKIVDLATGEPFAVNAGISKISVEPYALRSFKMERGYITSVFTAASLVGMESEVPESVIADCKLRSGEVINMAQCLKAKADAKKLDGSNRYIAEYLALAKSLESFCANRQFGYAYMLLEGYTLKFLTSQVAELVSPINWKIIGPFDNIKREAFEKVLPVEKDLLAGSMEASYPGIGGKPVSWRPVTASSAGSFKGIVDLMALYGGGSCDFQMAYAVGYVKVDADTDAKLILGSDDGLKVWLNGQQVFSVKPERGLVPGEDTADVKLKKGWNIIVLKIDNNVGGWGFSLDIKSRDGIKDIPSLEYGAVEKVNSNR